MSDSKINSAFGRTGPDVSVTRSEIADIGSRVDVDGDGAVTANDQAAALRAFDTLDAADGNTDGVLSVNVNGELSEAVDTVEWRGTDREFRRQLDQLRDEIRQPGARRPTRTEARIERDLSIRASLNALVRLSDGANQLSVAPSAPENTLSVSARTAHVASALAEPGIVHRPRAQGGWREGYARTATLGQNELAQALRLRATELRNEGRIDEAQQAEDYATNFADVWATLLHEIPLGWLDDFDDPMVRELVLEALTYNQGIIASEMDALSFSAGARADSRRWSLGFGGDYQRTNVDNDPLALNRFGLQFQYQLDLFGGLDSEDAANVAQLQALKQAVRADQLQLAVEVAQVYTEMRAVEARLAVGRAQIDQLNALIGNLEAFIPLGNDEQFGNVRSALTQARDTLRDVEERVGDGETAGTLEAQADGLRSRLSLLLGRGNDSGIELPETMGDAQIRLSAVRDDLDALDTDIESYLPYVASPVGSIESAIAQRGDVSAADYQVRVATERTDIERAAQLPKLTLGAGLGSVSGVEHIAANALLNLFAPLFRGNNELEAASLANRAEVARYMQVVLGAVD
ncbi:MAG: TolC family protein, partial [Myxococcota bacterium]